MPAGIYMRIDLDQASNLIQQLRDAITPEGWDKVLRRTMDETGKRAKTPIYNSAKTEYTFKGKSWFQSAIHRSIVTGTGYSVGCVIPLAGARGTAQSIFSSGGQVTKGRIAKGDRSNVWIQIAQNQSRLPYHMDGIGGQPPFKNIRPKPVMTRLSAKRLPITPVVGIAMPQMPLNQAEDETSNKILELFEQRLAHNFNRWFATGGW